MIEPNLFIIHGAYGNPNENWFPWLKAKVERLGIKVYVPEFPTPQDQSLHSWNDAFKPYEKILNNRTVFVGHSLGPAFILNLLERMEINIAGAFLVSPFIGLLNIEEFDSINFSLTNKPFDWDKIKRSCKDFFIYHSDNDPYVPQDKSRYIAKMLDSKVYELIVGGGHLNKSAGFEQFPLLYNDIKTKILYNAE